VLRVLLCWITGEPLQRRDALSLRAKTPDVVQLLHHVEEGVVVEAREVASRRLLAELYSGDTRYAGLEALENPTEQNAV
jgi:hypothetical protein